MNKEGLKRRKRAGILALTAAVALVITGTFAWQSISQKAINNVKEKGGYVGARLHDDFDNDQDWEMGANKDVYVENYSGQNPKNPEDDGALVYVRVRLAEYMEIGDGAGEFEYTGVADPIDYQSLDEAGTGGARTPKAENEAIPVAGGDITKVEEWPIHIPDGTVTKDSHGFHDYWDWNMGGSKNFMPTFNKDNTSYLTDRTEYGQNEFDTAPAESGSTAYADPVYDTQTETHSPKPTESTASVLTMAAWMAMGHPIEDGSGRGYWVGDTDGWFYWSKALAPGTATGLLLDGITFTQELEDDYYYAIHITSQMASNGEWGVEADGTGFYEDGFTTDGKFLLDQAAGLLPTITAVTITEGETVYVRAGQSITLHADVDIKHPSGDVGEEDVTWSISPDNPAFVNGTLTTQSSDIGNPYRVTASSNALPAVKTDTIKVVVYPDEGVGVVGPMEDGKVYLNYGDNTYKEIDENGNLGDFKCAGMDQVIGNADDIAVVSLEPDDRKYLGPNPPYDNSIAYVGADGKLGTEDDEKWWYNPDHDNMVDSPYKLPAGSMFTDEAGVIWRILTEESGHKLVMTQFVYGHGTSAYNTSNVWLPLDSGTTLKTDLQTFYANQAGADTKAAAVAYQSPLTDVRNSPSSYASTEKGAAGKSHPGTAAVAVNGSDAIFVLSLSEANYYLGDAPAGKVAYFEDVRTTGALWWTRSPGATAGYVAVVNAGGGTNNMEANGIYESNLICGFRPALWVKVPS